MLVKTPSRLVVAFGVIVVFLIGVLLVFDSWKEYQLELSALKKTLEVDARLLAEHVQLSLVTAQQTLGELEDRIRRDGIASLEQDKPYWEQLRGTLSRTPQLALVAVADVDGRVRFSTNAFPAPDLEVSDRESFKSHIRGLDIRIGSPTTALIEGTTLIPITVRRNGPGREFQGILIGGLDRNYFQAFYASLWDRLGLRIGMVRHDGTVLSLYPDASNVFAMETQDKISEFLARHKARTHVAESPIDGEKRVIVYRALDTYPVAVGVSYDYGMFVAGTVYPLVFRNAIIFCAVAAVIAFSVLFIRRATAKVRRAREAQHAGERLSHAIIHRLPKGRVAVLDRERRYIFAAGQAFSNHPRLASGALVGKAIDEVFSPEILHLIDELIAAALAGRREKRRFRTKAASTESWLFLWKIGTGQLSSVCFSLRILPFLGKRSRRSKSCPRLTVCSASPIGESLIEYSSRSGDAQFASNSLWRSS